jgi:L-fuconolactonase
MIDTHVHLWDLQLNIHAWVNNSPRNDLKHSFTLADYLETHDTPEAIVTIESADDIHTLVEVEWIKHHVVNNSYGIKIRHMAHINMLQDPTSFIQQLSVYDEYPFVCGFRHILLSSPNHLPNFKENLLALKNKNYIFNCQMYPEQLLKVCDEIVDSGVICIIDHAGLPDAPNWQKMLQAYAQTPVYFKITDNSPEVINKITQYIPINRLLLGSNYPVSMLKISDFSDTLTSQNTINSCKLFNF